jgi:hypothetical protein
MSLMYNHGTGNAHRWLRCAVIFKKNFSLTPVRRIIAKRLHPLLSISNRASSSYKQLSAIKNF